MTRTEGPTMPGPADGLQRVIAVLRDDYACALPGKIAEIEELWRRLLADEAPAAQLQEVARMVHGIAGSGATFGLAAASDAARELGRFLQPIHAAGRLPDTAERKRVAALIAALRDPAVPAADTVAGITEVRRQEALLKTGALQNAILNSANFSSIATDEKGVIQIFNVGAERMLGYTAADVLNKITPADISDPQEVIARAKALSLELATTIKPGFEALVFKASRGIEDIYELTYIRKDGSRFPAIVSVTALRDDQGAIIGYLLIGTDNTARKQVEAEQQKLDQRLRDQQFYTRSLIESNIDALMTTDASGIITDVNKQMEALTGCTRDELIGAPCKNYFTDPERAEAGIKRVLSEKKLTNYELTAHARDGKETVVSYNATTFYDRDRRLQGVFAAARDVTERKRLDRVLQEKNIELERLDRMKSEFISTVSHELRTPLTSIRGSLGVLASGVAGPLPDKARSFLEIAQNNCERLIRLIADVLDIEKIESGQMSFALRPLDLMELIGQTVKADEGFAAQHSVRLQVVAGQPGAKVHADPDRLAQVMTNLISNACKFSPPGSTVDITVSREGERLKVAVADYGIGISEEFRARIFQRFSQADSSDARQKGGTGLGLSISKAIVERLGGEIGFTAGKVKGTSFYFFLPECSEPAASACENDAGFGKLPQAAAAMGQAAAAMPGELKRILYVEDESDIRTIAVTVLEAVGRFTVLACQSGQEALEAAPGANADLILLDVMMPGMDGPATLKALREMPETARTPVIFMTAKVQPGEIQHVRSLGAIDVIPKPFDPMTLSAQIREIWQRRAG